MATAKIGALSSAFARPSTDADAEHRKRIDMISSRLMPNDERDFRDESLAFAGGMREDPARGVHGFGGALSNAFAEQSKSRAGRKNLEAQYLPQMMEFFGLDRQREQALDLARQRQTALFGGAGGTGALATGGEDGQAAGEGFFGDIARKFKIPLQAVIADYEFDGGKGIRAMINERTKPSIKFQDGAAFDETAIGQGQDGFRGFTPGVATSADGKTTMRLPVQGGGIKIMAPEGAAATYKQFQDVGNRSAADFQTETVTPRGENPQLVTRSGAADLARQGPASGSAMPPSGAAGLPAPDQSTWSSFEGEPSQILRAIDNIKDPQERSNALDAYGRQMTGKGGAPDLESQMRDAQNKGDVARAQQLRAAIERQRSPRPTVGMELESPAEAARAAGAVKTETEQYADQAKTLKNARTSISQLDKAIKLMERGKATASGLGAAVDSTAAFFGKQTEGAADAEELKNIQGWIVANVPRMEGPQSNFDVLNYQQMAGVVGNANLPLGVRLAAAKRARDLIADAAPKHFGRQDWDRDEEAPTSLVSPDAIRAERERRKGAK